MRAGTDRPPNLITTSRSTGMRAWRRRCTSTGVSIASSRHPGVGRTSMPTSRVRHIRAPYLAPQDRWIVSPGLGWEAISLRGTATSNVGPSPSCTRDGYSVGSSRTSTRIVVPEAGHSVLSSPGISLPCRVTTVRDNDAPHAETDPPPRAAR